jgi:Protein of unknown function (DUF3830)
MERPDRGAGVSSSDVGERIEIEVGKFRFIGRLECELAPLTCLFVKSMLPLNSSVLHCRWSGESVWMPFEEPAVPLPFENHTSHPHPGQLLIYAHGFSEPEILMPYGSCAFNSKVGQLAGNHFLTLESGMGDLAEVGRQVLWHGAKVVSFKLVH